MFKRLLRPVVALSFIYLIYYTYLKGCLYEGFESQSLQFDEKEDKSVPERFEKLVNVINQTTFDLPLKMGGDLGELFSKIITLDLVSSVGHFYVVNIGQVQSFSIFDVLLQDVATLSFANFTRVDFIVDSIDPNIIKNVLITPDTTFSSSSFVVPGVATESVFQIKNPLHLFAPYSTSDNERIVSDQDTVILKNLIKQKEYEMSLL